MKKLLSLLLCSLFVLSTVVVLGENYVPSPTIETKFGPDPYLVLVNKENKLPDNWLDLIVLKPTNNCLGEDFLVEGITLEHFEALRTYLIETEGVQIELDSTYRSPEEQQEIWDEWLADPELGPEYCEKYLAKVGYSEHHTGLAIDIFIMKDGQQIRDNDDMIADVEDFAKIHQHLAKFGFILRFPPGKETITGYNYEPWHFRFVGEDVAKYIFENSLTLEEFLEQYK